MSVNLRRFVNLNVSRIKRNVVNPVRDTVALFGAANNFPTAVVNNTVFTSGTYQHDNYGNVTAYVLVGYDYDTKESRNVFIEASAFDSYLFYAYAKNFFKNGGAKLHVYVGTAEVNAGKINVGSLTIPNEEIAIAGIGMSFEDMNSLAATYNGSKNPSNPTPADAVDTLHTSAAKEFVTSIKATSITYSGTLQENIAVKYGEPGIEMTILAYLSRINVYGENTVNQYAFTIEDVDDENVFDNDEIVGTCMDNFINIDCYLSKAIRNVGGDLVTGFDLVNYYATIIMQQTVEEAIMNVLSDKLSGAEGTAVIYNAAVTELNKYVRCGLFSAGNWEDIDWVVEYEDESYVVANAGERLAIGYKLLVIPFAAMTQEAVASHLCPPIYLAMTNKYGIRKVSINGEVR